MKRFKTENGARKFLEKEFENNIYFLVSELNQDKDCVLCDLFLAIEGRDMGEYTLYEINNDKAVETLTEIEEWARG